YQAELRAKTPDELQALASAELAKELAERTEKAECEEQHRFFNKPEARADFEHWSRMASWRLDEAVALSFAKAPEVVNWDRLQSITQISTFALQYGRRLDLALRARTAGQLLDPVPPILFLGWAKNIDLALSPELEIAVAARGVPMADWKKIAADRKA